MTNEFVLEKFKGILFREKVGYSEWLVCNEPFKQQEEYIESLEIVVQALEKQIPKKPIVWENKSYDSPVPNDDWGYECPCCGDRDIDYPEHHCECGQALDWSE